MRNYFITGLSGYLGHALLSLIQKEKDYRVFALVLPHDKYRDELIKEGVHIIEGDLLNKDDVSYFLSQNVEGEKVVIHIAGRISTMKKGDPLTTKINVEGTKNVLDRSIENLIDKTGHSEKYNKATNRLADVVNLLKGVMNNIGSD